MSDRQSITLALSSLIAGNVERARAELEAALRRHEARRAGRREREELIRQVMREQKCTARQARALLAVDRPELNWKQQ
jgi:hypothetical protein